MNTTVDLVVASLAADRQFPFKEVYANQKRSRKSRNEQIVVRHQHNNNGKR